MKIMFKFKFIIDQEQDLKPLNLYLKRGIQRNHRDCNTHIWNNKIDCCYNLLILIIIFSTRILLSTNSARPVGQCPPLFSTLQESKNIKTSSVNEKQIASLTKVIEDQNKYAHEQHAKLSKITNKMDNIIERRSSQSPLKLSKIQHKEVSCLKQTKIEEIHISNEGLITID